MAKDSTVSRRSFMTALTGAGLVTSCDPSTAQMAQAFNPPQSSIKFMHGVASGDPLAKAVIIWTRVTSSDLAPVPGKWVLSKDPQGKKIVKSGHFQATATNDFCVKVDVEGLQPEQHYFYRFEAGEAFSAVGRTKTAALTGNTPLRMALISCSHLGFGYFNVYNSLAKRNDIDIILHLGDYIYEYSANGYGADAAKKMGRLPRPSHEIVSLDDYRQRHAQYKSDPDLQAAHASAPWICIWDDHESANDSHRLGADNHQPDLGEGPWSARKQASVRSYLEWMPIREPKLSTTERSPLTLSRQFRWGDLADLFILETRLTGRDPQLDYEQDLEFRSVIPGAPEIPNVTNMREKLNSSDRYMISKTQENWLKDGLFSSVKRGAVWQVLANQTLMSEVKLPNLIHSVTAEGRKKLRARLGAIADPMIEFSMLGLPFNTDAWDGYAAQRGRIYDGARKSKANMVVCTGDSHAFWLNRLSKAEGSKGQDKPLAVEFGTSSVTSPSFASYFDDVYDSFDQKQVEINDEVIYTNGQDRGYIYLKFEPTQIRADYMKVNTVSDIDYIVEKIGTAIVKPAEGRGIGPIKGFES